MINSEEKILKIVAVYFAPSSYISNIIENDENATITFHEQRTWEEIKFAKAQFSESENETDDGAVIKQKLNLLLAGDDETIQAAIKLLKVSKPIIRIDYDNEVSKLIGDTFNYCQMLKEFNSEEFETKREIQFVRNSSKSALFIL